MQISPLSYDFKSTAEIQQSLSKEQVEKIIFDLYNSDPESQDLQGDRLGLGQQRDRRGRDRGLPARLDRRTTADPRTRQASGCRVAGDPRIGEGSGPLTRSQLERRRHHSD